MKHYILTRWNLSLEGQSIYNNPAISDPQEWMSHRMKLFEKYTLPSVLNQTNRNFQWLMSFAPETPKEITDKYDYPFVKCIYQYPTDYMRGLYGTVLRDGDHLITSRLDNDDMLEPFYVERIQAVFDKQDFLIVDPDGRQLDLKTGKFYTSARKTPNSPFLSLIEKVGLKYTSLNGTQIDIPIKTCCYCSHSKMTWHFPAKKIYDWLWIMVIHDRNVSNKIVGELL